MIYGQNRRTGSTNGKRIKAGIDRLCGAFIDSLYPRRCPVCGEIAEGKKPICRGCFDRLSFVKPRLCVKCGKQTAPGQPDMLCRDCRERPRTYEYGCTVLNYDDILSESLSAVKYHNKKEYMEAYGRLMAGILKKKAAAAGPDILVPVPVSPDRLQKRGFNQAAVLARILGEEWGIPVREDILVRTRQTAAMKELTPDERLSNLMTAFAARQVPEGAGIMIIDDIYTTGATVEACTRVLKNAGAGKIWYASLAAGSAR